MIYLRDCLLTASIDLHWFCSTLPGGIIVGKTKLSEGEYYYSENEQFIIPNSKLHTFLHLLKKIGAGLLQKEFAKDIQLKYSDYTIVAEGKSLVKKVQEEQKCSFEFSAHTHFCLLISMRNLCFFTVNPSSTELAVLEKLSSKLCKKVPFPDEADEECIEYAVNSARTSEAQGLILQQYAKINWSLVKFHVELVGLTQKKE